MAHGVIAVLRELGYTARDWLGLVPRAWRLAAIAVLVVGTIAAVVRPGAGPSTESVPALQEARAAAQSDGPTGLPMLRPDGNATLGIRRSPAGAAAAAISYTSQRQRLLTGATSSSLAAEIGGKLALSGHDIGDRPAAIPDRAADRDPDGMLATRKGMFRWISVPIAYGVRTFRPRRATVRVFAAAVNVASDAALGPGAIAFALRDVTLDWVSGAWRIRSVRDAADQPTPAMVVATDSRSAAASEPLRDRVLGGGSDDSTGLFDWLSTATALELGPKRLRASEPPSVSPGPRALTGLLADGFGRRVAEPGSGSNDRAWGAAMPIAFASTTCPPAADAGDECFEVLVVATRFEGSAVAVSNIQLAGIAVTAVEGRPTAVAYDLPRRRQVQVLGGRLQIATAGHRDEQTTAGAWNRSIRPLTPAVPASPR